MRKLNFALVGAGGMGRRWADGFLHMEKAALRVVCDKDKKRAQAIAEQFPSCRAETDIGLVAKANDVDAVIVALPHTALTKTSRLFLRNKKHVLCEKPGGVSSRELAETMLLAKEKHAQYTVGYNHRFHDGFLKAYKEFKKGTIGNLMFIRCRYGFGGRAGYEKEWRLSKKAGGGELLDQGVHMIDLSRWFMGEVGEARGYTTNSFWRGTAEDNAFILLKSKDKKAVASIHVSWSEWRPAHCFEIYGTKGYLIVDGLGRKYKGSGGNERLIVGTRTRNFGAKERIVRCDPDANKSLTRELESFVRMIQKREISISADDALHTLRIVEDIYAQNR